MRPVEIGIGGVIRKVKIEVRFEEIRDISLFSIQKHIKTGRRL